MKYVVIHIRTGGLIAGKHSLLEFGAMVEDTKKELSFDEIPKFQTLVEHLVYHGDAFALNMNRDIFQELSLPPEKRTKKVVSYERLAICFTNWLIHHVTTKFGDFEKINFKNISLQDYERNEMMGEDSFGEPVHQNALIINVAGKNFGLFQEKFLNLVPDFKSLIRFNHRVLDPSILFLDTNIDEFLPGAGECKKRANLTSYERDYSNTLTECWDTIGLFRKGLKSYK